MINFFIWLIGVCVIVVLLFIVLRFYVEIENVCYNVFFCFLYGSVSGWKYLFGFFKVSYVWLI